MPNIEHQKRKMESKERERRRYMEKDKTKLNNIVIYLSTCKDDIKSKPGIRINSRCRNEDQTERKLELKIQSKAFGQQIRGSTKGMKNKNEKRR